MSDLSQFGVDVSDPDDTTEEDAADTGRSYPNGRCPAIAVGTRQRCAAPVSRMKDAGEFCGIHGRQHEPWTIHDNPEKLILVTGRLDGLSLSDLDAEDVDFDLEMIRAAVEAVGGESDD